MQFVFCWELLDQTYISTQEEINRGIGFDGKNRTDLYKQELQTENFSITEIDDALDYKDYLAGNNGNWYGSNFKLILFKLFLVFIIMSEII